MTPEEQELEVADTVAELKLRRENRQVGVHNVQLAAFHDTRATFQGIRREVRTSFRDRPLPHFAKDDFSPGACGFVENSYLRGLTSAKSPLT